jgi:hypothetical protein
MKKKKPLAKNSLELRNLVRHPICPPTTFHLDKKKEKKKNYCRKEKP